MPPLVSLGEIRSAAARLRGVAVGTPLVEFPGVAPRLLIKPESLQPTGSFKLRGAFAAISALPAEARQRGVVAHSSGNHAQAVAYAASLLAVRAVVVVPENAPEVKIGPARALGATVVTTAPGLAAREAATAELVEQHGYTLIPPFDNREVIAGQGTVGLEIATACPDVGLVAVPVSGGGLIAGVAAAVRALCPRAVIVGVEPELAADARDSLRERRRVAWPAADAQRTIADSLRVEQVGALPLEHILSHVDDIVTVSEEEIRVAVRRIAAETRLVAEPGGAVAVAACLQRERRAPPSATRVAVLSGGNIAPDQLARLLAEGPALEGGGGAPSPAPHARAAGGRGPA